MKLEIVSDNKNYLAKVVRLPALRKHANADRLQCVPIMANNVITGLDAKEGDLYIFFPLECAINLEYLKFSNSFSDAELNTDPTKKGFFNKQGRVKAVSLRGEKSEGYIVPVLSILDWCKYANLKVTEADFVADTEFDTIGGTTFVKKYVNFDALRAAEIAANKEKNKNKKAKRESKLIENQFRVSEDTTALKRDPSKIKPDDIITIGYKMHGCNISIGRVLCKRPLKWYDKLAKKLGIQIVDSTYDLVYASRRVIKNAYADKKSDSFYDMDVWTLAADKYKGSIKDGVVLYGELVGQLPNGKWIQTSYDYGCAPNTSEFYVYRGTMVSAKGEVFEMTTPQLQRYCAKFGIKTVPFFYYGKARDWDNNGKQPKLNVNEHWSENFLKALIAAYNEKDCYMCKNFVPEEGVVVIKEADFFEAYKVKSFKFLKRESDELDKGEVNIEDVESAQ